MTDSARTQSPFGDLSRSIRSGDATLAPEWLAHRLAGALAIPTISRRAPAPGDAGSFAQLRGYLETTFPQVHRTLRREVIGTAGALLYTWIGTDATTRPWLLSSHQDVVPVEAETETLWSHPPFGGDVANGYV